jgi:hypothetical protein
MNRTEYEISLSLDPFHSSLESKSKKEVQLIVVEKEVQLIVVGFLTVVNNN